MNQNMKNYKHVLLEHIHAKINSPNGFVNPPVTHNEFIETMEDLLIYMVNADADFFSFTPDWHTQAELPAYFLSEILCIESILICFNRFHRYIASPAYIPDSDGYVKYRSLYLRQMFGDKSIIVAPFALDGIVGKLVKANLVELKMSAESVQRFEKIKMTVRFNEIVDSMQFPKGDNCLAQMLAIADKWKIAKNRNWSLKTWGKIDDRMRGVFKEQLIKHHQQQSLESEEMLLAA